MRRSSAPILGLLLALPAAAQQPLSAIDWLDDPVPVTSVTPIGEAPVATGVALPDVVVMPLDGARRDAVGLLPAAVTGLPPTLWTASREARLQDLWARASAEPLPAVQALYYTLLLAEAEPPDGDDGAFLKTRVETLAGFGAVQPAHALLARAGPETPLLFPLWFDLSLLTGDEGAACTTLRKRPELHKKYAARIFCMARDGDWQTAALQYDTARTLGLLTRTEDRLLALYLDPDMVEDAIALAPPSDLGPLIFRLYEAAGTPLPTRGLPRAFATADLDNTSGWKAELEAAERLTRTGALSENRLLGLYTDRKPAASGGIWDRVAAVQAFDAAATARDPEAMTQTLNQVWRHMQSVHLEVPFAAIYAEALRETTLDGPAAALAWRISLLGPDYETAASKAPQGRDARFLADLARGNPAEEGATTRLERQIAQAFTNPPRPAAQHADLLRDGKLGEAILTAATLLDNAGPEDFAAVTRGLATLRAVGLEDTARRAALQRLLLERDR